jgi:hypothetical protein
MGYNSSSDYKRKVETIAATYGEPAFPLKLFHEPMWEWANYEPITESIVDYRYFLVFMDIPPSLRSVSEWGRQVAQRGLVRKPTTWHVTVHEYSRAKLYRWVERAAVHDIFIQQRTAAEWFKKDEQRRLEQFESGKQLSDYGNEILEKVKQADIEPNLKSAILALGEGFKLRADAMPPLQLTINQMRTDLNLIDESKRKEVLAHLRAARDGHFSVSPVPLALDKNNVIDTTFTDITDTEDEDEDGS